MKASANKVVFWDFDGVLMNSNQIRDNGFQEVLVNYPKEEVNQLLEFHHANGGLSRYVKFRYFFEEVRGEKITNEQVNEWANKFSKIMLSLLIDKELLIPETLEFVKTNYKSYHMHIVSGSDGNELRQICRGVEIDKYFKDINGSPTPKKQLVAEILNNNNYFKEECVLIGDSINDYEAANENDIQFLAYNNKQLESKFTAFNPFSFK